MLTKKGKFLFSSKNRLLHPNEVLYDVVIEQLLPGESLTRFRREVADRADIFEGWSARFQVAQVCLNRINSFDGAAV